MPRRTDISSILIIGAGPIVIGQAAEFDYSGSQAVKALKEEGYRVIVVNSNPATIMTDPELADATYVEPITPAYVAAIIARERPDAVLPTMGGQTALNTALALFKDGTLEKYGVTMIGADAAAIEKAEDRLKFRQAMEWIGLESPRSAIAHNVDDAMAALETVGLPAIIRPSFTLGGTGGGIAYNRDEFAEIVRGGLEASPTSEVLIEESVLGWKEYEMEVVRDRADNAIIICSIENVDPMGMHTGDSITVAPALTLTDKEYQIMRNASIAVLREIGVETGGSNVQFAVNPKDGRLVVIEMNPRVSRSSALASKATGFPIAKVAAKLAVGYTLDEIRNDITGVTPASFEPTIDYVVTKIPRFAFEKFKGAEALLSTSMKSVGEVMAIGRSFHESLQKALRGLETGLIGLDGVRALYGAPRAEIEAALALPSPDRLLVAAQALREGLSVAEIHAITRYDPWFLERIEEIVEEEERICRDGLPGDAAGLRRLKAMGFSDRRLAELNLKSANLRGEAVKTRTRSHGLIHDAVKAMIGATTEEEVRRLRHKLGVRPVFKRIDTCAAEFEAKTPYMYSTYEAPSFGAPEDESQPSDRRKVVILGGGPNRIGQGIEFDYCCVHAAYALAEAGYETIMVNCNPETVSTDYDTSDRLYFEPLTVEDVLEILHVEASRGTLHGVIVQFGGQTPLKLAAALEKEGIPDPRHLARRDRPRRGPRAVRAPGRRARPQAARQRHRPQPRRGDRGRRADRLSGADPALLRARRPGDGDRRRARPARRLYPHRGPGLRRQPGADRPISARRDRGRRRRHFATARTSSSPASCSISRRPASIPATAPARCRPTASIPPSSPRSRRQARALARALGVVGLMNVQFAVKDGVVYLIEVNPRASRTVPFVAKAIGAPIAKIAARVMAGEPLMHFLPIRRDVAHIAVKEAVFPFARFPGIDPVLSPEMKSTGEVMGIADDFATAFLKSQQGAGLDLPTGGTLFVSVKDSDKPIDPAAGPGADRARLQGRRDRRHRRLSAGRGPRGRSGSTRWRRAGRTSSTGSRTAASTSSSTPPRAGRATRIRPRSALRR